MAKKCSRCGKNIGFLSSQQILDDKDKIYKRYCLDCADIILDEREKKIYVDIKKFEDEEVEEVTLSIAEKQLLELQKIRHDVNIIYVILLILFIASIIGIFVNILSSL